MAKRLMQSELFSLAWHSQTQPPPCTSWSSQTSLSWVLSIFHMLQTQTTHWTQDSNNYHNSLEISFWILQSDAPPILTQNLQCFSWCVGKNPSSKRIRWNLEKSVVPHVIPEKMPFCGWNFATFSKMTLFSCCCTLDVSQNEPFSQNVLQKIQNWWWS